MRDVMGKSILALTCFVLLSQGVVWAEDFFDVIGYKTRVRESGDRYDIVEFDPVIYGSKSTGAWYDTDKDQHWDDDEVMAESVKIYNRKGGLVIESPADLTRGELQEWAENNAKDILEAIFPGGITQSTGVTDDGLMTQLLMDKKVFKKTIPIRKADKMVDFHNDFKGSLEFLILDVDGNDGHAESIVLGYANDSAKGVELGFLLPYRYSAVDDEIDSESHFIGLDLYFKVPAVKRDKITWNVGGGLAGSMYYLTSNAIDHAGNYKYGAGVFTSVDKSFDFGGTLSAGMDYKYSKSELKASLVDTDNKFVEEAIDYVNDLDPVHNLTYGFNFGFPMGESWAMDIELVRTHFISDDIPGDRDVQTLAAAAVSYFPNESFELNVGLRKTFELEDIDVTGIMIGAIFRY